MNTVRSSLWGWGAFAAAVTGGMYAAIMWRDDREAQQIARGSKDIRPMSFEEKIRKAEWEAEQDALLKAGKTDEVHPMYLEIQAARQRTQDKVGKSTWSGENA